MPDDRTNYMRAGMHGGCKCDRRHWRVIQRNCNHSAFNGYHRTPSDYSSLQCTYCGHCWRTKARYVDSIPSGELTQRPSE